MKSKLWQITMKWNFAMCEHTRNCNLLEKCFLEEKILVLVCGE